MGSSNKIDQLRQWISQLIPGEAYDKYVQELAPKEKESEKVPEEVCCRFRIFTKNRCRYAIVGVDKGDDDEGYLGCVMSNDYSWAGEDHQRGHDLPDGPFNIDTWHRIVNAIAADQLRELGT